MPPRQKPRQELPQLKPHIYCIHFICAVSAGMGGGARRVRISAYTGQFYRRAIFVLFCIFPRSVPLPRRRGAPYVNIPQIPVQRCGILLHFVLYWVQNQHSRAAPGAVCQRTSTLPYRECRGEHCSPANLAQQRSFGKASLKANGHGRAMLAPTMRFLTVCTFPRRGRLSRLTASPPVRP